MSINIGEEGAFYCQTDDEIHRQVRARGLAVMEQMAKQANKPSASTFHGPPKRASWLNTPGIEIIDIPTKKEEEEQEEEEKIQALERIYRQD